MNPGNGDQLSVHVDADWAGETNSRRRSRTGILVRYGKAPIYASSSLQKSVSLSSAEAEYVALSEACRVIAWLRQVLNELGIRQNPTNVAQDNTGSISWAEGGAAKHFSRRKQIDLRYHYVIEKVRDGSIRLEKVGTEEMEADFLTKALGPSRFANAIAKTKLFESQ